jgi:hypothetical protein
MPGYHYYEICQLKVIVGALIVQQHSPWRQPASPYLCGSSRTATAQQQAQFRARHRLNNTTSNSGIISGSSKQQPQPDTSCIVSSATAAASSSSSAAAAAGDTATFRAVLPSLLS